MISIKNEVDQRGKSLVIIWHEGDIVTVLENWEDIDRMVHELIDCAAAAWPEQSRVE